MPRAIISSYSPTQTSPFQTRRIHNSHNCVAPSITNGVLLEFTGRQFRVAIRESSRKSNEQVGLESKSDENLCNPF